MGTADGKIDLTSGALQPVVDEANDEFAELYKRSRRRLNDVTGNDVITATTIPVLTAYTDQQPFLLTPVGTNTGAVTLAIDSLAAKPVVTSTGAALQGGELISAASLEIHYDSANGEFRLDGTGGTAGGTTPVIKVYPANDTWTKPAGLKYLEVTAIGSGGHGGETSGNMGSGGGGGATVKSIIAEATLGSTETVTVGAGGSSIKSSLGTLVVADFGLDGANNGLGGAGGTVAGSTGDIRIPGQDGGSCGDTADPANNGGGGGSSGLAYGAGGGTFGLGAIGSLINGELYGGGGGGGTKGGATGVGAGGGVIVIEHF